jgi:hypothetical protein
LIAVLNGLLAMMAPALIDLVATWPAIGRLAATVVVTSPAAFCMGMVFPGGLRRLERWHAPSLRWAWSVNAAAAVLGSVASIVLAMYLGLRMTLMIGGVIYLAALGVVLWTREGADGAAC